MYCNWNEISHFLKKNVFKKVLYRANHALAIMKGPTASKEPNEQDATPEPYAPQCNVLQEDWGPVCGRKHCEHVLVHLLV